MDASQWRNGSQVIVVSDLSVCTPREALARKRRHGFWKLLDYETPTVCGTCVAAGPLTDAPPLTLSLGATGWHAVYVGLAWHYGERNLIRLKLSGDRAYQHRAHNAGQNEIQEVFFKCADLANRDLHFAQQSAGFAKACVLMYVRLVPMTAEEIDEVRSDTEQRFTKRIIATIDGSSYLYDRRPTTKDELLEEFENYRETDFGTIWYGGAEVGLGGHAPPSLDDFPGLGYQYHREALRELAKKGIDVNRIAVEAAHDLGMSIHMSMRPGGFAHPVPFEDMNAEPFDRHPEWRCEDKDGTPLLRMSFAVPEVREYVRETFRRALESGADGVNLLFNRGCSVILWEAPFCALFSERYREDARNVADDDPRIYHLRAELMTTFMRELRQMLDEMKSEKSILGRLELSAMLLGTEELNRKFGLDVERWVREGLIDTIGLDWAAFDAHSSVSGRAFYDLAYYKRITDKTDVGVYPLFVPIEWQAIGDPSEKYKDYHVGDLRRRAAEHYDGGARGLLFWDVGGAVTDGTLWPIIRRMGHVDEIRRQVTDGKPRPVVLPINKWAHVVYGGRFNPWAGG